MENYEPQERFLIHDLETLRTLSDPLRSQIYEYLIPAPANVRQIGERLGLAPSRLYYHVNLLEKHGLLRVVDTRMVGNVLEKYYRSVAFRLDISQELLNFSSDEGISTVENLVGSELAATRDDMLRSFRARLFHLEQGSPPKPRSILFSRTAARINDAYAAEFHTRLQELIEEFSAKDIAVEAEQVSEDQPGEQRQNFALLVAFYPSFYYPGDKTD